METTPSAGLRTTPSAGLETTPYAGLVTRAIALLVDALVINVIAVVTGAVLALIGSLLGVGDLGVAAALTGGFLWLGWTGLYFIVFWITTGQTPGARLLGIRVVSASPRPLGIVRASLRFVVMMLALIPLGAGFLTVLFDDRRRGPHDMVADTVARWAPAVSPALPASPASEAALASAAAAPPAMGAAPPPAPAPAPVPATAEPRVTAAPPVTATAAAPPPATAPRPATDLPSPPAPLVGEVVGPASDGQADGRVPHRPGYSRLTTDQPPPTRFERPSGT